MLIVTIAALVMAAGLGWFAYRLMQEEQRRSEARVALLSAALQDGFSDGETFARSGQVGFAPTSLQPSSSMLRAARETPAGPELVYLDDDEGSALRFRSERTTATVAADPDITVDAPVLAAATAPATPSSDVDTRPTGLFADVPDARPADARGVIALAGVVLVAALAVGYVWFGRAATTDTATQTARPAAATPVAAQGGVPLELVSLTHEQRGNALVVRGVVRNPVAGSDRNGLVASVMLLDQAGGFLGSGRGPLATTRLAPGARADFSVELPSHKDVRRYRVTFRGTDGALVPHADKRQ